MLPLGFHIYKKKYYSVLELHKGDMISSICYFTKDDEYFVIFLTDFSYSTFKIRALK